METPREESDQLPEEGPPEEVPEYTGGVVRDEAERTPGVPEGNGQTTGHEESAG